MAHECNCGGESGCLVFIRQKEDDINPWFSLWRPHWHVHSPPVPNIQLCTLQLLNPHSGQGCLQGLIQVQQIKADL